MTLDVALGPRGYGAPGCVARIGHVVRGCLLCEAAAVLIAEHAPELDVEALLRAGEEIGPALAQGSPFPWPALEMFAPVRGVKSRRRCVTLPFEALAAALGGSVAQGGRLAEPRATARAARSR